MSKNMTRKGLAFGAGFAMVASGMAAAPAVAAIDDSAISLTPNAGTQYGFLSDEIIQLDSTQSAAADDASGNVQFLITDEDSLSGFWSDNASGLAGDTINTYTDGTNDTTLKYVAATQTATISGADNNVSSFGTDVAAGDFVELTGFATTNSSNNLSATTAVGYVTAVTDAAAGQAQVLTVHVDLGSNDIDDGSSAAVALEAGAVRETEAAEVSHALSSTMDLFFDATTDVVTIDDDTATNDTFATLSAGDLVKITGMTTSTTLSSAFTAVVRVESVLADDEGFTFRDNLGISTIATGSREHITAGTFEWINPTFNSDDEYVLDTRASDATSTDSIYFAANDEGSFSVQAWIDDTDNDSIDSTESSSSVRTLTSYDWDNSGVALNITDPVAGAEWEVWASFNSAINVAQIPAERLDVALGVLEDGVLEVGETGTTVSSGTFTAAGADLTFDSSSHVEDYWGFAGAPSTDLDGSGAVVFTAGYTYAGQLFRDGSAYGNILYTVQDAAVGDKVTGVTATLNENVHEDENSAGDYEIREEYTGSVELKVYVSEADTSIGATNPVTGAANDVPVPAGTVVDVTISETSLDNDSTITSNGETLANGGDDIEYEVTTDADGYATITLSNDQGEDGDQVSVTFTHGGNSASTALDWELPTPGNAVLLGGNNVSIEAEDTFTVTYAAADEFGKPLSSPDYRVEVIYYTSVGDTTTTTEGINLDANGVATLTIEDASEAVGNYTIEADLEELDTSADYADYGSPQAVDTTVYVIADLTPADVTLAKAIDSATGPNTEPVLLEPLPTRTINGTLDQNATLDSIPGYSTDEEFTLSGVVTNAAGQALRGVPVTLSATGVMFNTTGNYGVGTFTTSTNNVGAYSVEARSNTAGDHTVVVTAGSATEDVEITFSEAAEDSIANVDVDMPSAVKPGQSFNVTVTLTDAYGNGVETSTADVFTLAYDGPGIALSVPSDTDSNGEAKFSVLLGSNDVGTGTVTVTVDADDSSTTVDDNFSVEEEVEISSNAGVTQKVNAGSFKGYVAVYALGYEGSRLSAKIGNDWVIVDPIVNNESDNLFRVTDFTGAGVDIAVRIYIDRVLIDTINLTTK